MKLTADNITKIEELFTAHEEGQSWAKLGQRLEVKPPSGMYNFSSIMKKLGIVAKRKRGNATVDEKLEFAAWLAEKRAKQNGVASRP